LSLVLHSSLRLPRRGHRTSLNGTLPIRSSYSTSFLMLYLCIVQAKTLNFNA
ncbi:hypothetical protein MRX96_047716, partial [Rhipicephalus microplus]